MRRRRRSERGSAVPFAVAVLGTLLALGAALGVTAAMVAAHRTAQAAADLAALAGARAVQIGGDSCGAAAQVATANGASVASCAVSGADVRLTVTVEGPHWLGQKADFSAQARAGPSTP